jgi:hypothetical protein
MLKISNNKFNYKLLELSKNINNYLYKINDQYTQRNKKTNIIDGLLFNLLYSQKNTTQESITNKINVFKNNKITRRTYTDRMNKLDDKFYNNFITYLDKNINNLFYNKNNNYQIITVDCSSTLLNKKLSNYDFKLNKNKESIVCLNLCMYNITYQNVNILSIRKKRNERKAFIEVFTDYELNEQNIYIFDRGFYDAKLFNIIYIFNYSTRCEIIEKYKIL